MGEQWRPVVKERVLITEAGETAVVEEILPDGRYRLERDQREETRSLEELRPYRDCWSHLAGWFGG